MQARTLVAALFLAAAACPLARGEGFETAADLASGVSLFQYGYDDEEGKYLDEDQIESWGAGGAKPLNFRLTFHFTGAYLMTTTITDDTLSDHWNDVWRPGLGGGVGFGVQLAPILRVGGGAGYMNFHGGKVQYGTTVADYDDMHFLPVQGEGTLCFPLDLDIESWFTPGLGFAPGIVPYIQIEFGTAYRLDVEAEQTTAGAPGPDLEIFKASAGVFVGARVGLEFRTESVAFYINAGYRLYNAPKEGRNLTGKVLELHSVPFEAGFALYFGA
ncbi:MAG: hypothetical protein ACYTFG_06560 [Planctomycetota bacterium]|jgi:hypothetical protein